MAEKDVDVLTRIRDLIRAPEVFPWGNDEARDRFVTLQAARTRRAEGNDPARVRRLEPSSSLRLRTNFGAFVSRRRFGDSPARGEKRVRI